jgi:hypothetical protein
MDQIHLSPLVDQIQLALGHISNKKEGPPASSENGRWWGVLRKLKVPPKVRIFWWRVINNFLPSNAELARRHICEGELLCSVWEPS